MFTAHRPSIARQGNVLLPLHALFAPHAQVRAGAPLKLWERSRPGVYRVDSGWCARTRVFPDGRAQIVDLLMPGDLIGLEWLDGHAPCDTFEALSDARLSRCSLDDARDLLASSPAALKTVLGYMFAKQEEMMGWVAVLGQGDARSRLAFLLLLAARRNGTTAKGELPLPLTQHRLGELLGLTSVHVNRMIRDLRESGLAVVTRGFARITNPAGLATLAAGYRGEAPAALAA